MSPQQHKKDQKLTFSEAMQELEALLQRVDNDSIDIDRLAEELQRASELLELCRSKIKKAEVEVHQIVQKLERLMPSPGETALWQRPWLWGGFLLLLALVGLIWWLNKLRERELAASRLQGAAGAGQAPDAPECSSTPTSSSTA